ncbi:MBOAT, membrane-bound O-acyltransferase family-domain-containing protein [Lipomyces oligophaga]|uniref:MBOAT, membrane-bound O-acyltransferase family-domain-containing protein n=1 Tax=Lipomyces oligophaga TaxID=45792 RepID=UPI0034CED8F0
MSNSLAIATATGVADAVADALADPALNLTRQRHLRPSQLAMREAISTPTQSWPETPNDNKKRRRRRFGDMAFVAGPTIFESELSRTSLFSGFYVLFWMSTFFLFIKTVVANYINDGYLLPTNIVRILYRDLVKIAATDLFLFLACFANVGVQKLVADRKLPWSSAVQIGQTLCEFAFVGFAIYWPIHNDYPWIGRVFLLLHSLVLLMKQHSYAFYCGYLSNQRSRQTKFRNKRLDARGLEPGRVMEELQEEIDFCESELRSSLSPSNPVTYPANVTFINFFWYMMFPTLVYEIEYPRTKRIDWTYVCEKVAAIFGVFFLMIMLAEQFFYPIVMRALSLRALPIFEKAKLYPLLLLDLICPFILMYLLTWYIIWEAILNAIAELARFADRRFYGPWWNSTSWDQFAREWNVPVHLFLLRHVYHSSISAFHVSKPTATIMTFLTSSVIHELAMFVIFKKFRGYLLALQMFQLPLVKLCNTSFMRNHLKLGSLMFWIGICTGPSIMCVLYLTF